MEPCLVTLTDLKARRAGLSASAELLVNYQDVYFVYVFTSSAGIPISTVNPQVSRC